MGKIRIAAIRVRDQCPRTRIGARCVERVRAGMSDQRDRGFPGAEVPPPERCLREDIEERRGDAVEPGFGDLIQGYPLTVQPARRQHSPHRLETLARVERRLSAPPGDDEIADDDIEALARRADVAPRVFGQHPGARIRQHVEVGVAKPIARGVDDLGHELERQRLADRMKPDRAERNGRAETEKCDALRLRMQQQRNVPLQALVTGSMGAPEHVEIVQLDPSMAIRVRRPPRFRTPLRSGAAGGRGPTASGVAARPAP